MYTEQVKRQVTRRTSFLDSIRAEIEGGNADEENNQAEDNGLETV